MIYIYLTKKPHKDNFYADVFQLVHAMEHIVLKMPIAVLMTV